MQPEKRAVAENTVATETPPGELEMSKFLLRTSHDLRTALRAIRVHADLLLRGRQAAQVPGLEERLGFIVDGAQKIDLLAEGIASYSIALQIQDGTFQRAPLNPLLRAVLAKLDKELRANSAGVTYDKLPTVAGDTDRLMEVFENLLRNALHHRGTAAPNIQITVERQPEEWLFAVRDNGPGIQAPYLESIFQPFVRLHGNRHLGPGLGLAISRIIVERHGGRIWAESAEGAGNTFSFTLPAN
jgi:light-regulated signal transduction histidine kinase (bacteriophytochrome)